MNRTLKMFLIVIVYTVIWYALIYAVEVLASWPWGLSLVTILGLIMVWPVLLLFWVPLAIIEIITWFR
jgi:hypothetical protein